MLSVAEKKEKTLIMSSESETEREKLARIDTSKYEGHTEGPWWINHEDGDGATSIWSGTIGDEADMNHVACVDARPKVPSSDSDLRLMADAPLLLAEVERLREGIKAYLDLDIETSDLKEMVFTD